MGVAEPLHADKRRHVVAIVNASLVIVSVSTLSERLVVNGKQLSAKNGAPYLDVLNVIRVDGVRVLL